MRRFFAAALPFWSGETKLRAWVLTILVLCFVAKEQAAPEYRIAEDVRLAIEPLVEFAIGLISVGHRPGLEDYHDRKITLEKRLAGAHLTSHRLGKSLWRLFRNRNAANDATV